MRRKAILIGSGGIDSAGFGLQGVSVDILRYQNHLRSNAGGAWNSAEIEVLIDPTPSKLFSSIRSVPLVGGLLLIFSGHAMVSGADGQTYLQLRGGEYISDRELVVPNALRQLFIIDACRYVLWQEPEGFEESIALSGFELREEDATRRRFRALFDKGLELTPRGVAVCYACAQTEAAHDTPKGGVFSKALLDYTSAWANQIRHTRAGQILPIGSAIHWATLLMHKTSLLGRKQHPEIVVSTQHAFRFPFGVAA